MAKFRVDGLESDTNIDITLGSDDGSDSFSVKSNSGGILVSVDSSGSAIFNYTVEVSGDCGVGGNFDVNTDKFTVDFINGDTDVGGTLSCSGDFDVNIGAFTVSALNGSTNVSGDFNVAINKFTVDGVTGDSVVGGDFRVLGGTSLDSTLTVLGSSEFNEDVTIIDTKNILIGSLGEIYSDGSNLYIENITSGSNIIVTTSSGDININARCNIGLSNVILDGDMEVIDTRYWAVWTTTTPGTVSKDVDAHSGALSLKVASPGGPGGQGVVVQTVLEFGRNYNISFWYKTDGSAVAYAGAIGGYLWAASSSPTDWTYTTFNTSNVVNIFMLGVASSTPGGWVKFDDLTVEESSATVDISGDIESIGTYNQSGSGDNYFNGKIFSLYEVHTRAKCFFIALFFRYFSRYSTRTAKRRYHPHSCNN